MRLCDFVEHLASNPACSQRKPGNKGDSVALAIIHDIVPFTIGKAVTVLNGDDGNNSARSLDVLPGNVRQSDQSNLPFVSQFRQSFNGGLKWDDRIGSVQLINIDAIQS